MEITAKGQMIRISPRKIRLVVDAVRNLPLEKALEVLTVTRKRAALIVKKTMESAIANAVNNAKLPKESLMISRIEVNEGPVLKRYHPSTRGRVHPYKKRTSHLMVVLKERSQDGAKS